MDGEPDPTRVTEQPALTRSRGRIWLLVGGAFALVALGVLVPEAVIGLPPPGVALAAAVVVVALYAFMVVVRVVVPERRLRLRLGLLAIGMLAIALVSLVAVAVVMVASWAR